MVNEENSPPKQPDFSVGVRGLTARVFDVQTTFDSARSGATRVYDRADFPSPILNSKISVRKVPESTGLAFLATIDLDPARPHIETILNSIREAYKADYSGKAYTESEITYAHTAYPNVMMISHSNGARMLLWFSSSDRKIWLSNSLRLSGDSKGERSVIQVAPPEANTVDYAEHYKTFITSYLSVLDTTAKSDVVDYSGRPTGKSLKRIINVGLENRPETSRSNLHSERPQIETQKTVPTHTPLPSPDASESRHDAISDLIDEAPEESISLDDVGGLHKVKKQLRDVAVSFRSPDIMKKWGARRPLGVLLYGEPGTGKTMLAEALANEVGGRFIRVKSNELYEKWLGDSGQKIDQLFASAIEQSKTVPVILFFDEFDTIIGLPDSPHEGGGANSERAAVAGIFKQRMTELASRDDCNILVVGATNKIDAIDDSIIRSGRFDYKVYIPMPDEEGRMEIISSIVSRQINKLESGDFRIFGDGIMVADLVQATDGMSGADITEIFRRLQLKKAMEEARGSTVHPVSQDDILLEIRDFKTGR